MEDRYYGGPEGQTTQRMVNSAQRTINLLITRTVNISLQRRTFLFTIASCITFLSSVQLFLHHPRLFRRNKFDAVVEIVYAAWK